MAEQKPTWAAAAAVQHNARTHGEELAKNSVFAFEWTFCAVPEGFVSNENNHHCCRLTNGQLQ
jgi:uncharacterized FAD-dependent dehydrogenase